MADFNYITKDIQGLEHAGEIQSGDERSAVAILRKKGLIVISIKAKRPSSEKIFDRLFNRVNFSDLVTITRQLATMVSSGLVLSESIDILEEQQSNKKLRRALAEISMDIKGGLTLAQSMGRHQDIFPAIYINLIKSGEASGKLDDVLLKMADSMEKEREFRAKIQGAMIYPALVISMMVVVMIIMMAFVIPKLTSLYRESTLDLPLPTKILITTSDLFLKFWWVALIVIITVVVALKRWSKTPDGSYNIDRFILRIPLVGKLMTDVILTNFNRTFGMLVSAGIPILEAINIVSDITGNSVFKRSLKDAYAGVEKGLPFSVLLSPEIFPRIVGQMIRVGEETGKVDEIFFKLSDYFESESDHLVKNLTVAIEPIILIILGIGVAFLVISIILPIYKLTTSF